MCFHHVHVILRDGSYLLKMQYPFRDTAESTKHNVAIVDPSIQEQALNVRCCSRDPGIHPDGLAAFLNPISYRLSALPLTASPTLQFTFWRSLTCCSLWSRISHVWSRYPTTIYLSCGRLILGVWKYPPKSTSSNRVLFWFHSQHIARKKVNFIWTEPE